MHDLRPFIHIVESASLALRESRADHDVMEACKEAAATLDEELKQLDREGADWTAEPGATFVTKLQKQGLDPYRGDIRAPLESLMAAEAHRFLGTLAWRGDHLPVFRNINALAGWERDPEANSAGFSGLGVYWSTDGRFALTTHGKDLTHTIQSEVTSKQVDWHYVVLQHLTYGENEIRVLDHEMVPILGVSVKYGGRTLARNVNHLKGKLFSVGEAWG